MDCASFWLCSEMSLKGGNKTLIPNVRSEYSQLASANFWKQICTFCLSKNASARGGVFFLSQNLLVKLSQASWQIFTSSSSFEVHSCSRRNLQAKYMRRTLRGISFDSARIALMGDDFIAPMQIRIALYCILSNINNLDHDALP